MHFRLVEAPGGRVSEGMSAFTGERVAWIAGKGVNGALYQGEAGVRRHRYPRWRDALGSSGGLGQRLGFGFTGRKFLNGVRCRFKN